MSDSQPQPQSASRSIPSYITNPVYFPGAKDEEGNASYELLRPLTTLRHCQDGSPAEARIIFTCRRTSSDSGEDKGQDEEFVMKIKVQVPGTDTKPSKTPVSGPSTTTSSELKALETFRAAAWLRPYAPSLVSYRQSTQDATGPLPGGYLSFTVMTKMPGESLYDLNFWGMKDEEREEIVREFMVALRAIHALHIEPVDCALRNVLWERETKRCTIIDFELWRSTEESISEQDETKELQRWGLKRLPPAKNWWEAWNAQWR
ncbi:uncharacterized protein Z518_09057 [Rhinocladiella mackenziei CBS 650.93]|uniref:Protein kinase domain-containing protein n=1 Tax=Rhinocladiella mackenziei CBS 650.93 TaxID=1442369 RepID=A0A0D2FH14_9EURO|nr:uncharacterized protein Z518_09057 [Rhinocladiella mackenziei CBS 650.93]KIX01332.1 hypothetical protein Z518_09057 [Rhinocladiella mackenziei CBS 650.93]